MRPAATTSPVRSRPAVKICGVCRAQDALVAAAAGADYVGIVLSPRGPRAQTLEQAAITFAALAGATVRRVGVFVDAQPDDMLHAAETLRLDVLQLHGDEPAERVEQLRAGGRFRVWKAVRLRSSAELAEAAARYARADALLLEGAAERGSSGVRFDWVGVAHELARLPSSPTIVVAGGLTPENVAVAIGLLRPAVVDVSSGVERVVGEKSGDRVRAFIAAARAAGGTAERAEHVERRP
ncbi:MAG: phosphoribosylanthranilate isomerase [Longimicrobiales bacterium]